MNRAERSDLPCDDKCMIGAAFPLFRLLFYVYRHSGRTGGVPVTIGIAPPPMMMAGRSHCLRRFYHARAVTERKFHYIQIIAVEPSASIGRCSACGAGIFRSFSVTLNSITLSCVRKDHGVPAARLPACRYSRYVSGFVPYKIFKVQRRMKTYSS